MLSSDEKYYWKCRGQNDAFGGKPRLFRKVRDQFIAEGDPPQDWTPEEEHERGEAYMAGWEQAQ